MSLKKFAYIRKNIPEDEFVPTSVGYEHKATGVPVIKHNALYAIIPHGDEFDDEEFGLHLEVNGFADGVFVNTTDFDWLEVEIPDKELNFVLEVEEMRTATFSVVGSDREEVRKAYQNGNYDNIIAVTLNEQQDVAFQRMFFSGEVDSIDRNI